MGTLVNNRLAIVVLILLIVGLFFWWGDDDVVEAPADSTGAPNRERAKTSMDTAYRPKASTTWPQQGSPYGGFRPLPGESLSTYESLNTIQPTWEQPPPQGVPAPYPYRPQQSFTERQNLQFQYQQPTYGNSPYPASPQYQFRPQEQQGKSRKRYTGNYAPPR